MAIHELVEHDIAENEDPRPAPLGDPRRIHSKISEERRAYAPLAKRGEIITSRLSKQRRPGGSAHVRETILTLFFSREPRLFNTLWPILTKKTRELVTLLRAGSLKEDRFDPVVRSTTSFQFIEDIVDGGRPLLAAPEKGLESTKTQFALGRLCMNVFQTRVVFMDC
jgi:hypothetical protein